MTEQPNDRGVVYAAYPCFKATRAFRDLDHDDAAREVEDLVKGWEGVSVRGVYSTVGFRADTDLMLWLVASSPDALQDAVVAFGRTRAGRELDVSWSFMGAVQDLAGVAEIANQPPILGACLPPDGNRLQLVRAVVAYGTAHPPVLREPAGVLALLALRDAFPCRKD